MVELRWLKAFGGNVCGRKKCQNFISWRNFLTTYGRFLTLFFVAVIVF
ncbi:hypothetical protein ACFO1V_07985 [Daeguia caeni]|uniref:Uncharacterized protein n=1 Tax=Daeguia caeni TaxID=439612 RepID=A0ABV9H6T0_9HYPH